MILQMSVLVGFTFYKGLRKRDAVQAVLALSPYVRPSVTSRSSIKTDKRIELVFGTEASFNLHYAVF